MFEPLTQTAHTVYNTLAQESGRQRGHTHVRPTDVLIALAKSRGIGERALTNLGAPIVRIRQWVNEAEPPIHDGIVAIARIPPSAKTKEIIGIATRTAETNGISTIDDGALLLALFSLEGDPVCEVLQRLGLTKDKIERELKALRDTASIQEVFAEAGRLIGQLYGCLERLERKVADRMREIAADVQHMEARELADDFIPPPIPPTPQ
jgi:ATP-dependent Clp protease ATP-binding subunit ClpA